MSPDLIIPKTTSSNAGMLRNAADQQAAVLCLSGFACYWCVRLDDMLQYISRLERLFTHSFSSSTNIFSYMQMLGNQVYSNNEASLLCARASFVSVS